MTYKTLAAREADFIASMLPSNEAKRLAPKLRELAEEHRRQASHSTPAGREMHDLEAFRVDRAAELIRILETEQFRQRESIKLYLAGREDRDFLRRVASTWNDDKPAPKVACQHPDDGGCGECSS